MLAAGNAVAEVVDLARKSGTPVRKKAEEIYDNCFVSDLEKSGFLKEIWGEKITSAKLKTFRNQTQH